MRRQGLAVAIVSSAAWCALSPTVAAAADNAGRVLAALNDVAVVRDGAGRIAARPDLGILPKDVVETGAGARAKLFMIDDTVLNLGEKSRAGLEQFSFAPESQRSKAVWQLLSGSVKVVVGRSELEVRTPTAVAAARGTGFFVWTEGAPVVRSCLMVLEGSVTLRGTDPKAAKEIVVNAGATSCASAGEAPRAAAPSDAAVLKRLSAETAVLAGTDWGKVRALPPAFAPEPSQVGEPETGPAGEKGSGEEVKGLVRPPIPLQPVVVIPPPPLPPPPPPPTVPPVVPPGPPPREEEQPRKAR